MTIGAALLLIAAGAVLRFAIATTAVYGIDLHMIGDILMAVGAVGLLLWLVIWLPRTRARTSRPPYQPPPPPADVPRRDGYYPAERYPADRYPPDRYPPDRYPADRYPPERYPAERYPADNTPTLRYEDPYSR